MKVRFLLNKKNANSSWSAIGRLSSVGIEFVLTIMIGFGLGFWCDSLLESSPVGTLIGLAGGIAAAFRGLFKTIKKMGMKDS